MNSSQASVKLSFDKTTTNLISIKLRMTFQREQRRFSFPIKEGILLVPPDFNRWVFPTCATAYIWPIFSSLAEGSGPTGQYPDVC